MSKITTLSGDIEKKLLQQDLLKEADSDEDGGPKTRVEFDSDFSEEEEEENPRTDLEPEIPETNKGEQWSKVLTKLRPKHNTGAKGVKADYEEAKQIMKRMNETKALQEMEAFKQLAYGATTNESSISYNSTLQNKNNYVKKYDADDEDDGNGSDSDSDEEFLAAYRQQRMQQYQNFSGLPQFGKVIYVEKFGFLDETDNADPQTYVITHVYEDYIAACRRMNAVLDQFAKKHPHVKVLKLIATEASQTLSHRALPAFLVYKNKELVNEASSGVNEHHFGNETFGVAEVEWFFATKYGIPLNGVDISSEEQQREYSGDIDQLDAWQSSSKQAIGEVNLLGRRVGKLEVNDNDDDDW